MNIRKIVCFFVNWKILVLLLALLSTFILPFRAEFSALRDQAYPDFGKNLPYLLHIWGNFDGFFYMAIAKRGYFLIEHPFFPLYPILIKWFTLKTQFPYLVSAQIISNLSFLGALLVVKKTLWLDKKIQLLPLVLLLIFTFPTSFFYGAVYNDSIFFLLATTTLYLSRKKFWLAASITGALATFARLNGLALWFFLFFEYLISSDRLAIPNWNWKELRLKIVNFFNIRRLTSEKILLVTLIPLAFLSYLFYVQVKFGSWILVFSSMKGWGQNKVTFPLVVFFRYLKIFFFSPKFELIYAVAAFELLAILFYLFILIYGFRKIRLSYWVFFAVSLLIPSLTGTFQGMPRYGLHLYPLFLSLALFLKNRGLVFKLIYFTVSVALLFFALTLFTRGYFVA